MKTTKKIEKEIIKNKQVEFKYENYILPHILIEKLINELGITKAKIIKETELDSNNAYKYFDGTRSINRDLFLKIMIVCNVDIDHVQNYLKMCGYKQLYVKHEKDFIVYKSICNNDTIKMMNDKLAEKAINKL